MDKHQPSLTQLMKKNSNHVMNKVKLGMVNLVPFQLALRNAELILVDSIFVHSKKFTHYLVSLKTKLIPYFGLMLCHNLEKEF